MLGLLTLMNGHQKTVGVIYQGTQQNIQICQVSYQFNRFRLSPYHASAILDFLRTEHVVLMKYELCYV